MIGGFVKILLPHAPLQQIAVLIDHFVQRSVRALGHSLEKLTDRMNLQRILRQRSDMPALIVNKCRLTASQDNDRQQSGFARVIETDEQKSIRRIVQPDQLVIVARRRVIRVELVPTTSLNHPQHLLRAAIDLDDAEIPSVVLAILVAVQLDRVRPA